MKRPARDAGDGSDPRTADPAKSATRTEIALMVGLAHQRQADAVELLLQGIFYGCYDWIAKVRAPLAKAIARINARRTVAFVARGLKAEITRQGLTPADLDVKLNWPAGHTKHVLARPWRLGFVEAELLCMVLGTSMVDLLPSEDE